MEEKIVIDKETLKALTVDTRVNILKLLIDKKHSLSYLSENLKLSKPTIKEHLDVLLKANLIKKKNISSKVIHYSLTFKGKRFIQPNEVKVLFAFITSLFATALTGIFLLKDFLFAKTNDLAMESGRAAAKVMNDKVLESEVMTNVAPRAMDYGSEIAKQTINTNHAIWIFVVFVLLVGLTCFFLGIYLKKKNVIVN